MFWFILWPISIYLSIAFMVGVVIYTIFIEDGEGSRKISSITLGLIWPATVIILTGLMLIAMGYDYKKHKGKVY